jgi:hypothetical protein
LASTVRPLAFFFIVGIDGPWPRRNAKFGTSFSGGSKKVYRKEN